jgi:hypothetical protein
MQERRSCFRPETRAKAVQLFETEAQEPQRNLDILKGFDGLPQMQLHHRAAGKSGDLILRSRKSKRLRLPVSL